jgi:hypothetical protein
LLLSAPIAAFGFLLQPTLPCCRALGTGFDRARKPSLVLRGRRTNFALLSHESGKESPRHRHVSLKCAKVDFDDTESVPEVEVLDAETDNSNLPKIEGIAGGSADIPAASIAHIAALVALCTLSVVICYADRANIADAIIPMSEEYGWSKGVNGIVLSSFFIGYASTQVTTRTPSRPPSRFPCPPAYHPNRAHRATRLAHQASWLVVSGLAPQSASLRRWWADGSRIASVERASLLAAC